MTARLTKTSLAIASLIAAAGIARAEFEKVPYNNPGLVVDLAVGLWAWPLPMDWDQDGDLDLVVSCPDVPHNGVWFFENPGGDTRMPTFAPPVRVGDAVKNARLSQVDGKPRVLTPQYEWTGFLGGEFKEKIKIRDGKIDDGYEKVRADQWHYADYDGDGALDLVVGIGAWDDYGWDDAHDEEGNWINGPLHGYVYFLRNEGTPEKPKWADPVKVEAGGAPVDVFGMPSPNFADFDNDGDLDLLCGEFLDGFTYFQNRGSRTQPDYAAGVRLTHQGAPLAMNLCMITPAAIDWDGDGDVDIICGDEDGRVAFIENTGQPTDGTPRFLPPAYFQQKADYVNFGALVTPVGVDWDADGDEDIVAGNSAGHVAFIENLGPVKGKPTPKWAAPVLLNAGGQELRILAGPKGSIQGPAEAKWGYMVLDIADWDHDGLPDLVANSIWGKVVWYRNIGTKSQPALAPAQPVQVAWNGTPPKPAWNWWTPAPTELSTQWRTSPVVVDWNQDGLNDLVMLDHEGYLSFFERHRREDETLVLLPGQRIFEGGAHDPKQTQTDPSGPLRLNNLTAGKSGRRKLHLTDWDGDGRLDLIVNTINAALMRNVDQDGKTAFITEGNFSAQRLAGHTTCPTTVDWNQDGKPDLLLGAEDGFLYYLPHTSSVIAPVAP